MAAVRRADTVAGLESARNEGLRSLEAIMVVMKDYQVGSGEG